MDIKRLFEKLKEKLDENEYETYISPLKFNEKLSTADNLVFNAPNEFMAKFVKTKFSKQILHLYEFESKIKANIQIQAQSTKALKHAKIDVEHIKAQSTILNPSFTFESFVVGDSNQFAYTTCKAASDKDKIGKLYNPIFIYGPTGLGKTHLLQSMGNKCLEMAKIVIYATSEIFIDEFTSNLRNGTLEKFKEKYKNCDILLIDDVQFFGKTDKIQEEFFHIFNEIRNKNGQIVMTSDKPPNMLKGITERLKSRFVNGIIADITPPELDTKIEIIRKKCEFNKINISYDVIAYIATSMGDNIREIEGIITNLGAYSRLIEQEISLDLAKMMMKDYIREKQENISINDIINAVCKDFNIKSADIKSNKRTKQIVLVRRIIIYLSRELTNLSVAKLAIFFEMKDHTAISHNIKKINEQILNDDELKNKIDELKNKILTKNKQEI